MRSPPRRSCTASREPAERHTPAHPEGDRRLARCGEHGRARVGCTTVKIDIWSDIVCPFCYLGKRRLEAALAQFEHADDVEVTWHSFEHDRADAAHERLMRAYFTDGLAVGDRDVLVRLAAEIGLDQGVVRAMLESDDYGNHVRSDEATAKMLGIESVPFFVLDRKYGVSGAQPVEVFTQALDTAWATRHEVPEPVAVGGGCGGGCGGGGCGGACGAW